MFLDGQGLNAPGKLADVSPDGGSFYNGFLAFLRLVGVVYMKRHGSTFTSTPHAYFNQFQATQTPLKHHEIWLQNL